MTESRVFIVTGAGRGIGRAIAHRFVRDGHKVVAVDINEADLKSVQADAQDSDRVFPLVQDVGADDSPIAAMAAAEKAFGRIDGLVNNAGLVGSKAVHDTTDEDFDRLMGIMARAVFRYSRAYVQYLDGRPGVIVNTASVFGIIGSPLSSTYAMAKAGVIGLTRQMALDYGPSGVRTNAIAPGLIETAMTKDRIADSPAFQRSMVDTTPWPRIGQPKTLLRRWPSCAPRTPNSSTAMFLSSMAVGASPIMCASTAELESR